MTDEGLQRVLDYYGNTTALTVGWRTIQCIAQDKHSRGDRSKSARASLTGYRCMACGLHGDAISIIMEMEQCDYRSAALKYKTITGSSHGRVSKSATRKSWGVPPFGAGADAGSNREVSSRVRQRPDLWGRKV